MNFQQAFIVCLLLTIVHSVVRLDFNGQECNKYLQKFGTANNADGSGASKIAFSGDAAFVGATSDVKVNLRYSDVDLFNDATYWGLVQEDGKTPETTSITLMVFKFPTQLQRHQTINKQWRYYSFTIKGADFDTRLIQQSNSNNYVYIGYYGIAFYAAGTEELQYTFYFDFIVTVNKSTRASIDAAFKPLSLAATATCTPTEKCTITPQTQINWCSDFNCTSFQTPDLHLNDKFVLQQVIITDGMKVFYLTGTEVWYTGYGLYKKAQIKQIDNSVAGSVKILLDVEIAWRNVTILVNSVLSNTVNSTRRLLTQTTFDTVTGSTNGILCIKGENSNDCPTCLQENNANGYGGDGCEPVCCLSKIISTVLLLTLYFVF